MVKSKKIKEDRNMLKSKFRLSSLRKKNNKMIALSQLFYI